MFKLKYKILIHFFSYIFIALLSGACNAKNNLPAGFVYLADINATILQDIRYASAHNFVGRPIVGYKRATCILTTEAAKALSAVQADLQRTYKNRYTLKVYDGYRPQRAVENFWQWSHDVDDQKMKSIHYPRIDNKKHFLKKAISTKNQVMRAAAQ